MTVSWFETARTGAAREFGRRNWRLFAAVEIGRIVVRKVVPTLVILAALGIAVGLAVRYSAWVVPRLLLLAVTSAAAGLALWAWRRWRWQVRSGRHRMAAGAAVLVLVAVVGASAYLML